MRFLCLPGAYGSAKHFKVQLAPFTNELTADNSSSFFFTQGEIKTEPPQGFKDYFGGEPVYKFFRYDGIQQNDIFERVRNFPEGETVEDVLRQLMPAGDSSIRDSIRTCLDALYRTMEQHGPFDGICAYSEGTVAAGILIMDEARRFKSEGRPRQIKGAVFFAGWPPVDTETNNLILMDMSENTIDIPSLHCFGADDPYLAGAMALFNICDQDTAVLFDHGKGHTIPRDRTILRELADAVRAMEHMEVEN